MAFQQAITQEEQMGLQTYKVKVPGLISNLQERGLLAIRGEQTSPAQFLIRTCNLATNTAYQVVDPARADETSMDSLWKIFIGLRAAGITVLEKGKGRPIEFEGDVFEVLETALG